MPWVLLMPLAAVMVRNASSSSIGSLKAMVLPLSPANWFFPTGLLIVPGGAPGRFFLVGIFGGVVGVSKDNIFLD